MDGKTFIIRDDNGREFEVRYDDMGEWHENGWRPEGWNQVDKLLPANHVAASFYIGDIEEGSRIYRGYHDPARRWNGWAMPRFERDVAIDILANYVLDSKENTFLGITKHQLSLLDEEGFLNVWPADEFGLFAVGTADWIWDDVAGD